ncbi:MAG: BRCT domain-containing protein [bacterium]
MGVAGAIFLLVSIAFGFAGVFYVAVPLFFVGVFLLVKNDQESSKLFYEKQQYAKTRDEPEKDAIELAETPKVLHVEETTQSIPDVDIALPSTGEPKINDVIAFEYADADGAYSQRTIKVNGIDDQYISGFCMLRNEQRTFRRDRILTEPYRREAAVSASLFFDDDDDWKEEVLFTGFPKKTKSALVALAKANDFKVRTVVTQNLDYLVKGKGRAPTKVQQAEEVGATIIDEEEFRDMCE